MCLMAIILVNTRNVYSRLNSTVQPFACDFRNHKVDISRKKKVIYSVFVVLLPQPLHLKNCYGKTIVFICKFSFRRQYFTKTRGPTSVVHMVAMNKGLKLD